jgi:hypothetical protein
MCAAPTVFVTHTRGERASVVRLTGRLEWNGDVVLSVHGVDELEQAIVELEGQALKDPFLVELFREDGASLH